MTKSLEMPLRKSLSESSRGEFWARTPCLQRKEADGIVGEMILRCINVTGREIDGEAQPHDSPSGFEVPDEAMMTERPT